MSKTLQRISAALLHPVRAPGFLLEIQTACIFLLWGLYLATFNVQGHPAYRVFLMVAPVPIWTVVFTMYGYISMISTWNRWNHARRLCALFGVALCAVCSFSIWAGEPSPGFFAYLVLSFTNAITYLRLREKDYTDVAEDPRKLPPNGG